MGTGCLGVSVLYAQNPAVHSPGQPASGDPTHSRDVGLFFLCRTIVKAPDKGRQENKLEEMHLSHPLF